MSIQNPNSSGQGYDPDHKNHPFHDVLTKHQYRYSHSTRVGSANPVELHDANHHTYKHLDLRDHVLGISPKTNTWAAGKLGSRKRTYGNTPEQLDKFLKRHVKRAAPSVKSAVIQLLSFYDENHKYNEPSPENPHLHDTIKSMGFIKSSSTPDDQESDYKVHTFHAGKEIPVTHVAKTLYAKHGFKHLDTSPAVHVPDHNRTIMAKGNQRITLMTDKNHNVKRIHHYE